MDWGLFVKGKGGSWVMRKNRLYASRRFYWTVLVINTILRFCWTLSFIPIRYLSATGVLTKTFSGHDGWATLLGPLIASAEIIRRFLWGLLRVEWEIVKSSPDRNVDDDAVKDHDDIGVDMTMTPMTISSSDVGSSTWWKGDMSAMDSTQLMVELSVYTSTFAVLGLLIAAHRGTL
jgi:EXS family